MCQIAKKVTAVYFSPTRTTAKIVRRIAGALSDAVVETDLTLPKNRASVPRFGPDDFVILGLPVYGGRIPMFLEGPLKNMRGDNTPAVIVALYGNRAYEDALLEMSDLLTSQGFSVIGGGAFIGEHSLTSKVAANRPDEADLSIAEAFGQKLCEKLKDGTVSAVSVPGNRPYKERMAGTPYEPVTADTCTKCGLCVKNCPMGIISAEDPKLVRQGCIHCGACVKGCPAGAKKFEGPAYEKICGMLETACMERKAPELFGV